MPFSKPLHTSTPIMNYSPAMGNAPPMQAHMLPYYPPHLQTTYPNAPPQPVSAPLPPTLDQTPYPPTPGDQPAPKPIFCHGVRLANDQQRDLVELIRGYTSDETLQGMDLLHTLQEDLSPQVLFQSFTITNPLIYRRFRTLLETRSVKSTDSQGNIYQNVADILYSDETLKACLLHLNSFFYQITPPPHPTPSSPKDASSSSKPTPDPSHFRLSTQKLASSMAQRFSGD